MNLCGKEECWECDNGFVSHSMFPKPRRPTRMMRIGWLTNEMGQDITTHSAVVAEGWRSRGLVVTAIYAKRSDIEKLPPDNP